MAFLIPVGGVAVAIVAGDRLSKHFETPGVAGEGAQGTLTDAIIVGASCASLPQGSDDNSLGLLVVFGASGGTGLELLPLALERGFAVRAFVRSRARLVRELGELASNDLLEIMEGDLADAAAVETAIIGARAVISVAGAKPETAPGPMTEAMVTIVKACRIHGVQKLIVQSCAAAMSPGERMGWFTQGRLNRAVMKWQLGSTVVSDNERVMAYLHTEARDLKWVVSRPASLLDGDSQGTILPCLDSFKSTFIRYQDLAQWTLNQVDSDALVGKMPRLYYPPVEFPM